jgi:hypothetical protein
MTSAFLAINTAKNNIWLMCYFYSLRRKLFGLVASGGIANKCYFNGILHDSSYTDAAVCVQVDLDCNLYVTETQARKASRGAVALARCFILPARHRLGFANPLTGRPYHQESLRKRQLQRAAKLAGLGEDIGWHTFRHTYRSCLDETGAPMKVQQELMRHASIQTTMNVYGRAMTETKRRANSQVVGLVFGPNSQHSPENTSVATVQ